MLMVAWRWMISGVSGWRSSTRKLAKPADKSSTATLPISRLEGFLTPWPNGNLKYRIEEMAAGDDRGKAKKEDHPHQQQNDDTKAAAPTYQVKKDDEDAYLMSYLAQQAPAIPLPGMSYELRRGQNQLGHYFDTSKHPSARPSVPNAAASQKPKKVTKKDLERFRKQKEEKKRRKNQWLYES